MLPQYKEKLDNIKQSIYDLAKSLLEANTTLLDGMASCDKDKFENSRSYIRNISSKANNIDNEIVKTLALYSPEAKDLRVLVAYLKITNEIIRASSNTRNFIKGFKVICSELDTQIIQEYAIPMQKATLNSIEYTLEIIKGDDEDENQDLYHKVLIAESKTDDLYEMIETNILSNEELKNDFQKVNKILSSFRKSEKISDRFLSISALLLYAQLGGELHSN